jgi:hypothetical protein
MLVYKMTVSKYSEHRAQGLWTVEVVHGSKIPLTRPLPKARHKTFHSRSVDVMGWPLDACWASPSVSSQKTSKDSTPRHLASFPLQPVAGMSAAIRSARRPRPLSCRRHSRCTWVLVFSARPPWQHLSMASRVALIFSRGFSEARPWVPPASRWVVAPGLRREDPTSWNSSCLTESSNAGEWCNSERTCLFGWLMTASSARKANAAIRSFASLYFRTVSLSEPRN